MSERQAQIEEPLDVSGNSLDDAVDKLLLNIDGYEGPIDILLELSRTQKVDLATISILQLVRQYLEFIDRAKEQNLELAADYLVMAAWLAYLKSKLFLPQEENSDEPSAEEMAQALQFQLKRLEAMQKAAEKMLALPQLGQGVYVRGNPETIDVLIKTKWNVSLYDLLKAYGDIEKRNEDQNYDLPTFNVMSHDDAMQRMKKMLGALPKKGMKSVWTTLHSFLPDEEEESDPFFKRSALASTFTAGLELVKQGKLEVRQDGLFRPVYLRTLDEAATEDV